MSKDDVEMKDINGLNEIVQKLVPLIGITKMIMKNFSQTMSMNSLLDNLNLN